MFRDRDKQPYRDLLPWSGEFAGKYLTASTLMLRLNNDPRLRAHLEKFVQQLVALQAESNHTADDVAYLDMKDWAAQSKMLEHVAAYAEDAATLTGAGD